MVRKKYYRKKYYKKSYSKTKTKKDKEIEGITALLALFGLGGFGIYQNYIKDNMEIINFYAQIILSILLVILVIFLGFKINKRRKKKMLEKIRMDNIPEFLRGLEAKIKEFKPAQYYKEERLYQAELVGFLKNNYPTSKVEETRDYKRPDIIIDDIAIEIKGPTSMSCLKTLPDKINSYIPEWDYLFIVLFNIDIHPNKEKNQEIYNNKKQQIIENTIDSKREKVFFIEI